MLEGQIFVEKLANAILELKYLVIIMVKFRSPTLWDSLDQGTGPSQLSGGKNLPWMGGKRGVCSSLSPPLKFFWAWPGAEGK